MTLDEYLHAIGLSEEHRHYARDWMERGWSIEEVLTQRCIDCHALLDMHHSAAWRFRTHLLRCAGCQAKARRAGMTAYEAKFVV